MPIFIGCLFSMGARMLVLKNNFFDPLDQNFMVFLKKRYKPSSRNYNSMPDRLSPLRVPCCCAWKSCRLTPACNSGRLSFYTTCCLQELATLVAYFAYLTIMAYGSTPYVGMTPKKNGRHIKSAQITRSKCLH